MKRTEHQTRVKASPRVCVGCRSARNHAGPSPGEVGEQLFLHNLEVIHSLKKHKAETASINLAGMCSASRSCAKESPSHALCSSLRSAVGFHPSLSALLRSLCICSPDKGPVNVF